MKVSELSGALLIKKPPGITSFGVVDQLKRRLREGGQRPPKVGHGGTLDPFAEGLLIVLVGKAVKLARYFLGANKSYQGVIRFGQTTVPGDPTAEISETTELLPESLEQLRERAQLLTAQPYLQTPPMHSAKKHQGRPLYELARQGIEIEREPKLCHLFEFEIEGFDSPLARFCLKCSSGTYVRTLAQDFGRLCGSLAMLESLSRTGSGNFGIESALSLEETIQSSDPLNELPCYVPFNRLLDGYERIHANDDEAQAIFQGRQNVLFHLMNRAPSPSPSAQPEPRNGLRAIYRGNELIAVARQKSQAIWQLERVFPVHLYQ